LVTADAMMVEPPGAPLVSCVVPAWNAQRFLRQAIDSVLQQTWRPLELIVVDDGSTDDTAAIARSYGALLRLLQRPNGGPCAARQAGVDAAAGTFVAFLDADDRWLPDKLGQQVAALTAAPEAGYCTCLIAAMDADRLGAAAGPAALMQARHGFIASCLLIRRSVFDAVPMPRESPSLATRAEFEWFARLQRAGVGGVPVQQLLAHRRLHRGNLSRALSSAAVDAAFDVIARHRRGGGEPGE
jgi:glycosyltransferase involved in cell wall biosynthesis